MAAGDEPVDAAHGLPAGEVDRHRRHPDGGCSAELAHTRAAGDGEEDARALGKLG